MPLLRLRVTGSDDNVRAITNLLQSLEGIEHVEEVADLMPHMDDADSSSAGLSDVGGPDAHSIEIDAPNESTARKVREAVEALAFDLDVFVEFDADETDPGARRGASPRLRRGCAAPPHAGHQQGSTSTSGIRTRRRDRPSGAHRQRLAEIAHGLGSRCARTGHCGWN